MILGSHNSWSYLKPRKWWMKPFRFMARCQDVDIKTQYDKYNVRYFDLRINFDTGGFVVVHSLMEYKITSIQLLDSLMWLNQKKDTYVRVVLDSRKKYLHQEVLNDWFTYFCRDVQKLCPNIKFCCGEDIITKEKIYPLPTGPSCEECYSSVQKPKLIDDWYPRLFALLFNKKIKNKGTDKEVLMLDFVNI